MSSSPLPPTPCVRRGVRCLKILTDCFFLLICGFHTKGFSPCAARSKISALECTLRRKIKKEKKAQKRRSPLSGWSGAGDLARRSHSSEGGRTGWWPCGRQVLLNRITGRCAHRASGFLCRPCSASLLVNVLPAVCVVCARGRFSASSSERSRFWSAVDMANPSSLPPLFLWGTRFLALSLGAINRVRTMMLNGGRRVL